MIRIIFIAGILIIAIGCDKAPTTKAEKYVDSWNNSGMMLPDKEQIKFFHDHLKDVREILISALSNSDPWVRQNAAYVIEKIGPQAMDLGPVLFNCLKKESKRVVRMYFYSAMAAVQYVDPAVIDDLRIRFFSLSDKNEPPKKEFSYSAVDEKIDIAAALYLIDIKNRKEYLEFVLRWLSRPKDVMTSEQLAGYWERRRLAVLSLESMPGATEAIPLLKAMLDEPNTKSWVSVHVPRVLNVMKKNSR